MKRPRVDKSLRRLRRRDDPGKTRAYAPGELHRLAHMQTNNAGIIRPDTGNLSLPAGLDGIEGKQTDSPLRVVLVIAVLALIWVIIITFFVARMPDQGERDNARQTLSDDGRSKSEAIK
jgi:hypothetical protein